MYIYIYIMLYIYYVYIYMKIIHNIHCAKNHISHVLEYHRKIKRPRKNHLSINFLAEKNTVFPITEKFKTTSQ